MRRELNTFPIRKVSSPASRETPSRAWGRSFFFTPPMSQDESVQGQTHTSRFDSIPTTDGNGVPMRYFKTSYLAMKFPKELLYQSSSLYHIGIRLPSHELGMALAMQTTGDPSYKVALITGWIELTRAQFFETLTVENVNYTA